MDVKTKIKESGIESRLPNCNGIHFFDLPVPVDEDSVGAWFWGDDEYEQAVCGIAVKLKKRG